MSLPSYVSLSDYDATLYINAVYDIFHKEVVMGEHSFLGLKLECPWHPPYDNKHFSFWHLISEKNQTQNEGDRIPDMERCKRIRWISYVLQNAQDKQKVLCWEKEIKTSRGKKNHIHLYLQEEHYLVVLRRQRSCLQLVTTFVVQNHEKRLKEYKNGYDPR